MCEYDKSAGGSGYTGSEGASRSDGAGGDKVEPLAFQEFCFELFWFFFLKKIILRGHNVVTMRGFNNETSQRNMMKFAKTFGPLKPMVYPKDLAKNKHTNYFFEALSPNGKEQVIK